MTPVARFNPNFRDIFGHCRRALAMFLYPATRRAVVFTDNCRLVPPPPQTSRRQCIRIALIFDATREKLRLPWCIGVFVLL